MWGDSTAEFVALLRETQILDDSQLVEAEREALKTPGGPEALAEGLQRRGWLTPFQVERLRDGRAREICLGPYRLLEPLGEGGMGRVFKARHRTMKRVVALKVIRWERRAHPGAVSQFFREIEAAARLSHPNIVVAHDAAEVDGVLFYVMEYVGGTDLAELLRRRGPLPIGEACDYARQVALGLQHIHEWGMVHRDVKPSNLIRADGDGTVKILDLGLAHLGQEPPACSGPGPRHDVDGLILGTPDFLAPEQSLDPRQADPRSDLYSLGCTMYQLLSGVTPFPGGTPAEKVAKHREIIPVPLRALRPELPLSLEAVVRAMIARRPEDRYQEARQVADALAPYLSAATPRGASLPAQVMPRHLDPFPLVDAEATPLRRVPRAYAVVMIFGLVTFAVMAGRIPPRDRPGDGRAQPPPQADGLPTPPRSEASKYRSRGVKALREARYDQALAEFNEALRLDTRDVETLADRAWARYNLGDTDRAFADLDAAIRINPRAASAFRLRGWLYLLRGDPVRGIEDCTRAIELRPDLSAPYRHRARCYALLGRPDLATADFDAAIRIEPTHQNFRERAAFFAERLDLDRAVADFDTAIRLDPLCADVLYGRGLVYDHQRRDDRAIADFDAAIRLAPNVGSYYASRGHTHSRRGNPAQAEADLRAARRLGADPVDDPAPTGGDRPAPVLHFGPHPYHN